MITISRVADLGRMTRVENLSGVTFTGEDEGHKFVISAMLDNAVVPLTGHVSGKFIRPNGATVALTESEDYAGIEEGKAWVILAGNCYREAGPFGLSITHVEGSKRTVIYACAGYIRPGETSSVIDPENVINIDAIAAMMGEMEDATEAAEAAAAFVPNVIAPAYSASATYAVGDYVTKDGYLYRCNTAISTAEAWTAAHWTQVTAGAELGDLKSAVNTIGTSTTKDTPAYWIIGGMNQSMTSTTSSTNRARIAGTYIERLPSDGVVSIEIPSTLLCRVAVYTEKKFTTVVERITGHSGAEPTRKSGSVKIPLEYNGLYFGMDCKKADDTDFTEEEVAALSSQIVIKTTTLIGELSNLITDDKSSVVGAINENKNAIDYIDGKIDDLQVETDKNLTEANVPADAKAVGDKIDVIDRKISKITEGSRNLLYVTDATDGTASNGVELVFLSPSRIQLVGIDENEGTARLCLNGNQRFDSTVFRPNIPAGTYYFLYDRGGINISKVYIRCRYSDMNQFTCSETGELVLTEDAEMFIVLTGYEFSGTIKFMLSTEEIPYEDYGTITAKDDAARSDITTLGTNYTDLNNRVKKLEGQTPIDSSSLFYRNKSNFTNHGFFPYKYYPTDYHSEFVHDIPLYDTSSNNTNTSGMCGDGVRYLWISTTSGETKCKIRKYDIMTNTFVQEHNYLYDSNAVDSVTGVNNTGLGHAQSMTYKDGEIYVLSYIGGTNPDTVLYADGGTRDRITVLDATTLDIKRCFGIEPLLRGKDYFPRLQAIAWSDTFKCFAGVTPYSSSSGYTKRGLLLFTEDGIIRDRDILSEHSVVCDGIAVDNSYISPMFSYHLAFYRWDDLTEVGFNRVNYLLKEQRAIIGHNLEAESVISFSDCYFVNANLDPDEVSHAELGCIKLFKVTPKTFAFVTE